MISRRNIRVKVMQTLYSLDSIETPPVDQKPLKTLPASKILDQHLDQTTQLFTYLIFNLGQVALYAEKYAKVKASKHLHTEADLRISTKISANHFLWQVLDEPGFRTKVERDKLHLISDEELVKKLFLQLLETPEYQTYVKEKSGMQEDVEILKYIFYDILLKSEAFEQHIEDLFIHWQDDKEMMILLMGNFFQKPSQFNFLKLISDEKVDYAQDLLKTAMDKRGYCMELIKPKLQNWDPDRIASIDMLLIIMGVCEFLYFPTIPTKVTINEYIDLAKEYSTPQSGQFLNGILDNILKDLLQENKIQKTDRIRK